jgi:alcohol dehydrogenase class IV
VRELCNALKIPPLSAYGVTPQDFTSIVEKTARASSTKANPIQLTLEELSNVMMLELS